MKVTITFEDHPDGGVMIVGDPSLEALAAKCDRPRDLTSAEGYAIVAWQAIKRAAREGAELHGHRVEQGELH